MRRVLVGAALYVFFLLAGCVLLVLHAIYAWRTRRERRDAGSPDDYGEGGMP